MTEAHGEAWVQNSVFAAPPTAGLHDTVGVRLVVSPCNGRFSPSLGNGVTWDGEWVERGQTVGEVDTGDEMVAVRSRFEGWIRGSLALEGQPIREGDALLWLRNS